MLDNLFDFEKKLANDTLNAMVYVAGYIELKRNKASKDTRYYYEQYGKYVDWPNRLTIAGDAAVQRIIYCYIFLLILA